MKGITVSITVPEHVYNDLRAMPDDDRQQLRDEYSTLKSSNNYVELWIFSQLVGVYSKKLYDIPADQSEVTAGGEIVKSEQSRDDDGNFI